MSLRANVREGKSGHFAHPSRTIEVASGFFDAIKWLFWRVECLRPVGLRPTDDIADVL